MSVSREKVKKLLPIIQAFAEGKQIQLNCGSRAYPQWGDKSSFDFSAEPYDYRIKPEPKLRPWKPEEVPVGALIRRINDIKNWDKTIQVILGVVHKNDIGPKALLSTTKESEYYPGPDVFLVDLVTFEYSIDNGKTWLPCGVVEE